MALAWLSVLLWFRFQGASWLHSPPQKHLDRFAFTFCIGVCEKVCEYLWHVTTVWKAATACPLAYYMDFCSLLEIDTDDNDGSSLSLRVGKMRFSNERQRCKTSKNAKNAERQRCALLLLFFLHLSGIMWSDRHWNYCETLVRYG